MLLSSKAFAGFLQELNQSGQSESSRPQPRQERNQPQPQPNRKDVNPHEAARQFNGQRPQVGMALVPEPTVDLSLFDMPSWNTALPSTDYHVFAVTELPRGPVLDVSKCTEKTATPVLSKVTSKLAPTLPELPKMVVEQIAMEDHAKSNGHKDLAISALPSLPKSELSVSHTRSAGMASQDPIYATESSSSHDTTAEPEIGSWESLQLMCEELDRTVEQIALWVPGKDRGRG